MKIFYNKNIKNVCKKHWRPENVIQKNFKMIYKMFLNNFEQMLAK